ncbi:stalk domain-containing protein [Paenibacillus filicis]|uniref:Stalk domain-containing protein n=1 Tax=Paenibacillus gyeongsangnamensis TaxID=3388067 RepID=A0ABT4Q386_9BACL|nr:stalk domain-containing protein [Paenibacillus filicis]MCZ8511165.1 stalk domain-containing protein [Paenibacillus filicis]
MIKAEADPKRTGGRAVGSKGRKLWINRLSVLVVCAGLLFGQGEVRADAVWDHWKAADAAVSAGNPETAVPHWIYLADHYASIGDYENAALFCGRLDQYYDGVKNYEQAIRYYELENEYWLKAGKDWGAAKLQRAEQLRTTIYAYISTDEEQLLRSRAAPAGGKLAKFEPEYGAYIGMYPERDPKMQNFYDRSEQFYGKKHALYLAYTQVGKDFPKQYAARAKQSGAALQIGWEPAAGLDSVTDDTVRHWARDAKAAGIPIFLRYASEMNGDWVPWHGDPKKYIEKFRMVHEIMAQEAPNVAMVWSPGDVPMYSMDAYYPGDDAVDWVGVSMYTEPYENGDPAQGNMQATSPVERLDHLYKTYADRKPLMISETAVSHYANLPKESFTDYGLLNLQRLYEVMPYKYPRLKSITYFNVNLEMKESKNDYLLRDNDAMLKLYSRMIASPYFLTKVEQGAKPSDSRGFVPLTAGQAFAKQAKLIPFVKIPDVYIGKLEYTLNGRLLDTQTAPPYGLELQAGDVPEGSVLQITAYTKDGAKAGSKSFPLSSRVSVTVDGKDLRFERPPVIRDGNTLTPLRAIFEAMGAEVRWDAGSQTATAAKGSTTVSVQIGSGTAKRNGQSVPLEAPAQLIDGSTMVPVRFIGEAFGAVVQWNGTARTVDIRTDGKTVGASAATGAAVNRATVTDRGTAAAQEPIIKPDSAKESGLFGRMKRMAAIVYDQLRAWFAAFV